MLYIFFSPQTILLRAFFALLTSFLIPYFFGPFCIRWLRSFQTTGQPIRDDGPISHTLTKAGTPTLGGVLILGGFLGSFLLWVDPKNAYSLFIVGVTIGFAILGGIDDLLKLQHKNTKGLSARSKILGQVFLSGLVYGGLFLLKPCEQVNTLILHPLLNWDLGILFFGMVFLVMSGSSNAVNLTDGLDGLAIGPAMIATAFFGIIAYHISQPLLAPGWRAPYLPHGTELTVICAAMIGAGLGFLWYNCPPAAIFMGDVGAFALGGFLGALSLVTKCEILWILVGGIFVAEACSVIIQVLYYKRTKKRIFLMAPLHHHFEKKGWTEPTIVLRFWSLSLLLALAGLTFS